MRIWLTALLLLVALSLTSCKKYLEGPYFSLSSKASRLDADWTVELAFDGQNVLLTPVYESYLFSIEKNGAIQVQFEGTSGLQTLTGEWTLEDNKDTFQWEVEGDTLGFRYAKSENFDILRLTQNEFWILDKEYVEIHLEN